MKKLLVSVFFVLFALLIITPSSHAQQRDTILPQFVGEELEDEEATESSEEEATGSAEEDQLERLREQDVTQPEEEGRKREFEELFERRPVDDINPINFIAYGVQYSYNTGIPANTLMLVLLLPFLASLYAFLRHVIGLPSIGMFLPIALSITLVATGITAGLILFGVILFSSTFARMILKHLRIMYLPKAAMHMLIVSVFIVVSLTISAIGGILSVTQLSIFPVLLLILLSEQIVSIQLERSVRETFMITFVTFFLGLLGWLILSSTMIRTTVLLYPETILLLIPINIAIGRYFGIRLFEYFRFSHVRREDNAN